MTQSHQKQLDKPKHANIQFNVMSIFIHNCRTGCARGPPLTYFTCYTYKHLLIFLKKCDFAQCLEKNDGRGKKG